MGAPAATPDGDRRLLPSVTVPELVERALSGVVDERRTRESDRAIFLANAMNPVHAIDVLVERDTAVVSIEEDQPSGGIGEGGLNARLAGQLTGLYVRPVKDAADLRAALRQAVADRAAARAV